MFGLFGSKKAEILNHWYALVPGFKSSTGEFYGMVEKELKNREIPGLESSRLDFSEGGALSAKREYLRMTRERLVFDVCAAPFGTSYFFSCRFAEIPAVVTIAELILFLGALGIGGMLLLYLCVKVFGLFAPFVFPFVCLALLILGIYVMRNAVALGLKDLDAALIKMPILGPIYEAWFRKDTYYRQDTRLMYLDTVNEVVKAAVEETTGAKGIKLLRFNEHDPILSELYKPRLVELQKSQPEPEPCLAST